MTELPTIMNSQDLDNIPECEKEVPNKKKLSILILTWEFPPNIVGGLARHGYGLARSLVKGNCEVHVLTTKLPNTPSFEMVDGIHVHRITPLHELESNFLTWIAGLNLAMLDKAKELSIHHHYSLIHAHDWLVGTCGLMLKKELNIPLIATIHSTEHGRNHGIYSETQKFIDRKERQLINGADQLIVCSDYMREEMEQVFAVNADKMAIIANGIDLDSTEISEQTNHLDLPLDSNRRLIFSIGRLVKEKGFDLIIDAAPVLLAKYPDIYFVIAGKGPMYSEYEQKIKDNGLEQDVFLVGYVDDGARNLLFSKCELAIFPSLYEPFGIVSLESMILAKPTIVAKTGGLKGIVDHLNTGLFMTPGDKESLIEQVQLLLENKELATELGDKGKRVVERLFSWQRIALETKRVYDDSLYRFKYLMP